MKRMAAAVFFLVSVGVALVGCTESTSPAAAPSRTASTPSRSNLVVGKWRLVQSDSIWPDTGEISLSYPWDPDISVEDFTPDGKWVAKQRKAGSYVYYSGSYSITGDSLIVKLPDYVHDYTIHVLTRETLVLDSKAGPFLEREYYRRIK